MRAERTYAVNGPTAVRTALGRAVISIEIAEDACREAADTLSARGEWS
ncbi:hypothetical protein [Williamsia sp.]